MSYPNTAPLLGTATVASPAGATTTVGTAIVANLEASDSVLLVLSVVGHAGGVLDVYVQSRHGAGNWVDVAHVPQLGDGAGAITYRIPLSRYTSILAPVVVGVAGVPALAANSVVEGEFGDALRLVAVGGAGGAGGAVQSCAVYAAACPPGSHS